jgi:tellurite resistance protein
LPSSAIRSPANLFSTILISLLLPILLVPFDLLAAQVMWGAGAVGMVAFAWLIVSRWMSDRQLITHATPAWIIPVVGLLDVPLALPGLGLSPMHGMMVLGLAVGHTNRLSRAAATFQLSRTPPMNRCT